MPPCDDPAITVACRNAALTYRERQVLEQIVHGLRAKEMARLLGMSPRTVEIHRSHILHKVGARNAVDLVRIIYAVTARQ